MHLNRWIITITIASTVFCLVSWHFAKAASFQYIFNNVEQGPNSTSSPSITIDGEKVTKKTSAEDPLVVTNVPVSESIKAPEPVVATATKSADHFYPFRLMILGSAFSRGSTNDSTLKQDLNDLKRKNSSNFKASANLTYFPLRNLGIGGFWGKTKSNTDYYGGDLEFIPLRMEVLGIKNLIEVGALAGYSTLGKEVLQKSGTFHAGARLNVNFSERFGISGAARTNLGSKKLYSYTMAEAGLALRF